MNSPQADGDQRDLDTITAALAASAGVSVPEVLRALAQTAHKEPRSEHVLLLPKEIAKGSSPAKQRQFRGLGIELIGDNVTRNPPPGDHPCYVSRDPATGEVQLIIRVRERRVWSFDSRIRVVVHWRDDQGETVDEFGKQLLATRAEAKAEQQLIRRMRKLAAAWRHGGRAAGQAEGHPSLPRDERLHRGRLIRKRLEGGIDATRAGAPWGIRDARTVKKEMAWLQIQENARTS